MTLEAGPPNVLEAIKAFKDAQEQRVNHWKEYDEAVALYEKDQHQMTSTSITHPVLEREERSGNVGETAAAAAGERRCRNGASSGHYHTDPLPMTDDIFAKILSLVTSGLLDSSHSVRTVETELRSRFHQNALADMVGQVQDLENQVLRKIVQRDQDKRKAVVEGRDTDQEALRQQDAAIRDCRQQIQELITEINAEVAEMQE